MLPLSGRRPRRSHTPKSMAEISKLDQGLLERHASRTSDRELLKWYKEQGGFIETRQGLKSRIRRMQRIAEVIAKGRDLGEDSPYE